MERPYQNRKGRGAGLNPAGRFARTRSEAVDDGWQSEASELAELNTIVRAERSRSIISRNNSPDIPFEQSINPYRGCEHGCIYCYARPTHAYLDLSPGLDFETRLFYKADAARLLENEFRRPGYLCKPITLGANTDPYQPIEKRLGITRSLLEVFLEFRHPVTIITKSALIERDMDLLTPLAHQQLLKVVISLTTLDAALKRTLEPRAASPAARLGSIRALAAAGVDVGTLFAPVIPAVNDHELERILRSAAEAGASSAGYVLLRLPREVSALFSQWLTVHFPDRATHVMSLIHQMRNGKTYDSRFGTRMRGTGSFADLLAQRFRVTCGRLGLNQGGQPALATDKFSRPRVSGDQLTLTGFEA